jgi:hypothetical protein
VRITEDALTIETRHRLWNQRVWTPPAVPGRQLLSRSGNQISAVELHGGDSGESLAVETASRRRLVIAPAQHESVDPIAKVTQAFEDRGLEGATQVYSSLRNAQALTARDHLDLAEMAAQQGLTEMAKQIAEDAVRDFSDNALLDPIHRLLAELKRKPSSVINRGDNGLDYIELAIRNNTPSTLQTEVQGPAKHPFSYGIPFPSGTVRIERWPIGTKLFRTRGELRGRVLLEVGNEDAGQTIDLSSDRSLRSEDKSGSLPRDES